LQNQGNDPSRTRTFQCFRLIVEEKAVFASVRGRLAMIRPPKFRREQLPDQTVEELPPPLAVMVGRLERPASSNATAVLKIVR
jgi:hypothetical protein